MKNKKNLRLKQEYIEYIAKLARRFFDSGSVWIFGSRIQKNRKGGDIDIFIQTQKKENILLSKIAFLREFEKKFGEQKIDLVVQNPVSMERKIFHIAKNEGIKI